MKNNSTSVLICAFYFLFFLLTGTNLQSQTPDSTFGQDGIVISHPDTPGLKLYWDGIVLRDRRLLVLGAEQYNNPTRFFNFLEIYDEHGQLDTAFGKMRIQPNDFIDRYVWMAPQGYRFIAVKGDELVRYSLNKEFDTIFGEKGIARPCANRFFCDIGDMAVAPDNKIILATIGRGNRNNGITLMRLNADGSRDGSFGAGGLLEISPDDNSYGVALHHSSLFLRFLPDGKMILLTGILVTASNQPPPVVIIRRINANGTIDRTYGTNGSTVVGNINSPVSVVIPQSFIILPDGSILLGARRATELFGDLTPHVYRVLSNGDRDNSVNIDLPDYVNVYLTQYGEGKIVVGGSHVITDFINWDIILHQFNSNGTLDTSFANNGIEHIDITPNADYVRKLVPDKNRFYLIGSAPAERLGMIMRYSKGADSSAITITSPVTGSVISAGTPITVQTSTSSIPGGWSKVDFLNYGQVITTDNTAPYEFQSPGVEAGDYWIEARAISNSGDTALSYAVHINVAACSGAGSITAEGFSGIGGASVPDLTGHPDFPGNPDVITSINKFEFLNIGADSFGARLRGFICPPATGMYRFYISSNDQSELWLSTNNDPANRQRIAWVNTAVGFREWSNQPSQQSAPVFLLKGVQYYIEALHKENTGEDHLSVAWRLPDGSFEGPIPSGRLIPYPIDPANQLLVSNQFAMGTKEAGKLRIAANPNPSSNTFLLSISTNRHEPVYIKVMDVLGRIVERVNGKQPNSNLSIGSRLSPGTYFIEVLQGNSRERITVLKR